MLVDDLKIENKENLSPMMQQYFDIREKYRDAIVFFRVGDFYETFFDQAKIVGKALNLVVTGKECGLDEKAPMCGVPHHAVNVYMSRLVKEGFKVAIAEQMEDPKLAKGIVKREVTQIITPGTVLATEYLEDKINNFIISIYFLDGLFGIALLDFSTGDFLVSDVDNSKTIEDIFLKYSPKEVLVNKNITNSDVIIDDLKEKNRIALTIVSDEEYDLSKLQNKDNELIAKLLKTLPNYNDIKENNSVYAAVVAYNYVKNNQKQELSHLETIKYLQDDKHMYLDAATIRNLELSEGIYNRDKKGTLISVLDKTKTAMGGRLLYRYIEEPLKDMRLILYRQSAISAFIDREIDLIELRDYLNSIYDLERIMTRIVLKHANAKDLVAFKNSIYTLPYIKGLLKEFDSDFARDTVEHFDTLKDLFDLIDSSIMDDPPYLMHEGNLIKDGFNEEVDKLRLSKTNGKKWLVELEEKERQKTGIKNLKIKYSRLTGYLFEISNAYKGEIPDYFVRKQTLANAERYHTKELADLESLLVNAEDRLFSLEYDVFSEVRETISHSIERISNVAKNLATIDVLTNLAYVAIKNNYVCPDINEDGIIEIKDGRHPVIEKLNTVETFISNDSHLDNNNFIDIITGPNMAGKSTYMRQVAIICLMAHMGSYVPASYANITLLDRIFTRVGASDDLTKGKSTFMVEMSEVANIVKNATQKSLIILDEIGRGTSTYDGLSIAWSVIEYISKNIKARTLFATHYHELTELEGKLDGVNNFNVAVIENDDDIKFLRKIVRGSAKKSFGIAVAKLAGVPDEITENAKKHLRRLMSNEEN